jgi:hypothetical protein
MKRIELLRARIKKARKEIDLRSKLMSKESNDYAEMAFQQGRINAMQDEIIDRIKNHDNTNQ